MIQHGKMIIEVDIAFTQRVEVLLPNMEAMLRTYLMKEACNGHMLFERPTVKLITEKEHT